MAPLSTIAPSQVTENNDLEKCKYSEKDNDKKPLSVSIPVNYHTFSGNSEKNHYHELSLTRQTKLNLKQRPCEENPNYSFTTCIKENIANKVTLHRKGPGILNLGRLQAAMGQ